MLLEEITKRIRAAADLQDLDALQAACNQRAEAIASVRELRETQPTPELRAAIMRSVEAGEQARKAVRVIKQRLRREGRRLAHLSRFALACHATPDSHIDFRG